MPLFRQDRLIGFGSVASHLPDIGGTLRNPGAKEIFEEGLQSPICQLLERGHTNDLLVQMIRQNVRVPEATMGDIWGQVCA